MRIIKLLLKSYPEHVHVFDDRGCNSLYYAVIHLRNALKARDDAQVKNISAVIRALLTAGMSLDKSGRPLTVSDKQRLPPRSLAKFISGEALTVIEEIEIQVKNYPQGQKKHSVKKRKMESKEIKEVDEAESKQKFPLKSETKAVTAPITISEPTTQRVPVDRPIQTVTASAPATSLHLHRRKISQHVDRQIVFKKPEFTQLVTEYVKEKGREPKDLANFNAIINQLSGLFSNQHYATKSEKEHVKEQIHSWLGIGTAVQTSTTLWCFKTHKTVTILTLDQDALAKFFSPSAPRHG
jgi:hypothetical protein